MKYFAVKVQARRNVPSTLFYQQEKGELFLGPHARLAGHPGMAHIESEALARAYAEACAPVMQKRYGNDAICRVTVCESSGDKRLMDRIQKDSNIIRNRLATANLASNKKP